MSWQADVAILSVCFLMFSVGISAIIGAGRLGRPDMWRGS